MKLIVITSSGPSETEHRLVTKMFEAGLETLHVRKPKFTTKQLEEYIRSIPAHFHNRIVIHSHHRLAYRLRLKGIHITRVHKNRRFRNWLNMQLLRLKSVNPEKSSSFRKISDLYEQKPGEFSYVFLSPIFDNLTGKYQSGFNEQTLRTALQKNGHRVIARGGVDADKVLKVKELGFYGMALYSSIWKSRDPYEEFLKVVDVFTANGIKLE